MDLAIDSAKSFVVDLAVLAENFTEAPEDVEWFEKLHPSLVKAYCPHEVDENEAPASSSATRQLPKKKSKEKKPTSSSKVRSGLSSTVRHGQAGSGNRGAGAVGRRVSSSRGIQSTKPVARKSVATKTSTAASRSVTASRRASSDAKRPGRDRSAAEDDDITALLAKHNKQFKPKSRYVARTHSSRDVKRWEVCQRIHPLPSSK